MPRGHRAVVGEQRQRTHRVGRCEIGALPQHRQPHPRLRIDELRIPEDGAVPKGCAEQRLCLVELVLPAGLGDHSREPQSGE